MSETEDLYPEFVRGMEIAVERGVSSGSLRNFLVMWRNVHGRPSAVTMIQTFLAEEGLKVDNLETDLNAVLGDDWRQTQIQLSPAIGRKVEAFWHGVGRGLQEVLGERLLAQVCRRTSGACSRGRWSPISSSASSRSPRAR